MLPTWKEPNSRGLYNIACHRAILLAGRKTASTVSVLKIVSAMWNSLKTTK